MGKFMLALLLLIGGIFTGAGVSDLVNISTSSMAPSLLQGDRVSVVGFGGYQAGDVVVFDDTVHERQRILRVVGVAGDVVEGRDNQIFVNEEIVVEPYRSGAAIEDFGPVSVGDGEYFLMGDWRSRTVDSREMGPIPLEQIEGRAVWRMWPLTRFGDI